MVFPHFLPSYLNGGPNWGAIKDHGAYGNNIEKIWVAIVSSITEGFQTK